MRGTHCAFPEMLTTERLTREGKGIPWAVWLDRTRHAALWVLRRSHSAILWQQEEHACLHVERRSAQEPRAPPKDQNLGQELLHIKWLDHLVNLPTSSAWQDKGIRLRESR